MTDSMNLRSITLNGADIRYVEVGAGEPVVLIHGAISDHRTWQPHREELGRHVRAIMPDLRYCGTGAWADAGEHYSIQTHADDIAALIRELSDEPVTLVGWSHGGAVALTLAVQNPDLVKGLVLYEQSLATYLTDPEELRQATEIRAAALSGMVAPAKEGDLDAAARAAVAGLNNQQFPFGNLPEWAQQMILENARTIPLIGAATMPTVTADDLRSLNIPVKLVVGGDTVESYKIVARAAARLLPNAAMQSIEGGLHYWVCLEPAAVNRLVLDFVAQHRSA
jgi:pimeloyl-ACP methyl ester carboxylesterase